MPKPIYSDLLNMQANTPELSVSRGFYMACLIGWIVSVAAIPLFVVFNQAAVVFAFILMIPGVIMSLLLESKNSKGFISPSGWFEKLLLGVEITAILLFFITLFVFFFTGGTPVKISDSFYTVRLDKICRDLTEGEYNLLCLNRGAIPAFGCCAFFSKNLFAAHARRVKRKTEAEAEGVKQDG